MSAYREAGQNDYFDPCRSAIKGSDDSRPAFSIVLVFPLCLYFNFVICNLYPLSVLLPKKVLKYSLLGVRTL
jgi:hypothetical protein